MSSPAAEMVARAFHEAYERLAPSFGYETRKASAVPWEQVPEPNRSLMVAVAAEVLATTVQQAEERAERAEWCEQALLNYIGARWCERCGGSGNGPSAYDGGACPGCDGDGLVRADDEARGRA